MSHLKYGLELAAAGFRVFPVHPESKKPMIKEFPRLATTDPKQVEDWAYQFPKCNWGVSTENLLLLDIDCKNGKDGFSTLAAWELAGDELPITYNQGTPSGGQHFVFSTPHPVPSSAGTLGRGVDIRGKGGYFIGRGSVAGGGIYTGDLSFPVAPAPAWLLAMVGRPAEPPPAPAEPPANVHAPAALAQATQFLAQCPAAHAGQRNQAAFKAAAHVKDLAVSFEECLRLMREVWTINCFPPLPDAELEHVVRSAYKYGTSSAGAMAPEAEFTAVQNPTLCFPDGQPIGVGPGIANTGASDDEIEKLNREYAFVLAGSNGNILWTTTDEQDRKVVRSLAVEVFHQHRAGLQAVVKDKRVAITRLWMASPRRKTYDGIVFAPGKVVNPRFFNLWQGFAVEPAARGAGGSVRAQEALRRFREHLLDNVCGGDAALARWLTGWFAHLVQRPWEKPLVAVCFRGDKGVGKTTLLDTVGALLGAHYFKSAKERHLTGDFNSHLENLLLFNLEEAFWAHAKGIGGVLNDLITNPVHVIERKGQEPYPVANVLRLAVIGNADTLIPASFDERRWACFEVQLKRLQARTPETMAWFEELRLGMEAGGYALLLRYLLDVDLAGVNINKAPATRMLHEQQVGNLSPFQEWWRECLEEGRLVGSDVDEAWPDQIDKDPFWTAMRRYCRERGIAGREPARCVLGKELMRACPAFQSNQKRRNGAKLVSVYKVPALADARRMWDQLTGHTNTWSES